MADRRFDNPNAGGFTSEEIVKKGRLVRANMADSYPALATVLYMGRQDEDVRRLDNKTPTWDAIEGLYSHAAWGALAYLNRLVAQDCNVAKTRLQREVKEIDERIADLQAKRAAIMGEGA